MAKLMMKKVFEKFFILIIYILIPALWFLSCSPTDDSIEELSEKFINPLRNHTAPERSGAGSTGT
jgi:uncharacterized protein YggT (Ycf19 family)